MRLSFATATPARAGVRYEAPEPRNFAPPANTVRDDAYFELKTDMHRRLIERLNLAGLQNRPAEQVRAEVSDLVAILLKEDARPLNESESSRLIDDLMHELLGFGPLEPLLQDADISDILVNTHKEVYVERFGQIELTDIRFADEQHLLRIIERIVDKVGRRIDESQPMVDARLPDGSRVNAVVPPIAVDGSLLSIRRFARVPYDMGRLVSGGSMDHACADMLTAIVACRQNILISGGTGTGKTTLLNAMSTGIGGRERIVTIEDAAELQLQQRHVARLETRPSNIEGRGEITQRELLKNALRMRPDRIIIGEVRSGEAFDMLQAMNTGHDGSMATVHANTPRDALARLEQMVCMAGLDLPPRAIRSQIASAIDVVVQLKRFTDGSRRVISVSEVDGMEGDVITMQEIFRFEQTGVSDAGKIQGRFVWTGLRPKFLDLLKANGIPLPEGMAA
ncbi:CpaF family protein [Phenylobacterium deserti]|uniref:CpaF family protein n=1 Tax=Phenylobacterium deserti TaxID=1914756 RepID=A0A328ACJ4_9CAUL|nr:CpaF family protein [Phenylobacterium deserti]RAK52533.1 CpaF family protein [Phenylobacterium deserti]